MWWCDGYDTIEVTTTCDYVSEECLLLCNGLSERMIISAILITSASTG
jgi:hypothetical protein